MDDTISRQAAIAVADSSDYVGLSVEDVKKVTDEVVKGLKRLPSAQPNVPERNVGKWIDDCSCRICHWIHEDDKGFALLTNYNFCPNCGANMDGRKDEYGDGETHCGEDDDVER